MAASHWIKINAGAAKIAFIRLNYSQLVMTDAPSPGEGLHLGQFLLGMCCWPLRVPTPL